MVFFECPDSDQEEATLIRLNLDPEKEWQNEQIENCSKLLESIPLNLQDRQNSNSFLLPEIAREIAHFTVPVVRRNR